jgi:hypothetical protein
VHTGNGGLARPLTARYRGAGYDLLTARPSGRSRVLLSPIRWRPVERATTCAPLLGASRLSVR